MRRSFALGLGLLAVAPATAAASAGGATYPGSAGGTTYGAASTSRPTVVGFRVPARVPEGSLPRVRFRIDEAGDASIRVRIAVLPLGGGARGPLSIPLGRQATGRTVTVLWPRATRIGAGRWLVRLHAVDGLGRTLVRPAYASGRATLTVLPKPKPKPKKKAAPAA